MNSLVHRPHYRTPSLLGLAEYWELEKQVEQRAACSREGALLEYETLELRVNPPNIIIENRAENDYTHIAIDSANRPGTLVEVSSRQPARRPSEGGCVLQRASFPRSYCAPCRCRLAQWPGSLHRRVRSSCSCFAKHTSYQRPLEASRLSKLPSFGPGTVFTQVQRDMPYILKEKEYQSFLTALPPLDPSAARR